MNRKLNKGWFRLSIVISLILLLILVIFTILILPDKNILYKNWYDEVVNCNNQGLNQQNMKIYGDKEYIQAQVANDYFKLIKLVEDNMLKNKTYFERQCNIGNRTICKNPFDQLDCPYYYDAINKNYLTELEHHKQEKTKIYLTVIMVYCFYLFALLSIWWICLGFSKEQNDEF
jgi:hypothetical protein